jgi:UDP-sugar diphosphatase
MISDVTIVPSEKSEFVKPKRITYRQNGVPKIWDMVEVHDSVAIVLYHTSNDTLIVVKQFRPPVYLKNNDGYTYELCAGIVDKDKSLVEIAHEEILEECGYHVPLGSDRESDLVLYGGGICRIGTNALLCLCR